MEFSTAFIKLFQVIEILSKFVYLPVWYKGLLLEILYSFSQVGEMISASSETLAKKEDFTEGLKFRYWSKLTIYGEYHNILHAQPVSSMVIILLLCLKLLWKGFNLVKLDCKFFKCGQRYIDYFYSLVIELAFIDLSFYCYYTLISDY